MADDLEAREAVRQAYSAYYRRLVAALYGMTGDYAEAQDVVQEAYARALARSKAFLDVADPEAWLRTVAVNIARTRWRRHKLFDTLVRTGRVVRTPESVPGADPNRVALVAALQKLSRPTREAIVLHHLADLSVYEVAQALGVPVGTVKARLSRGRAILAKLLSELADEPATTRPTKHPVPEPRAAAAQPAAGQPAAPYPTIVQPAIVPGAIVPGATLPRAILPGAIAPPAAVPPAIAPPAAVPPVAASPVDAWPRPGNRRWDGLRVEEIRAGRPGVPAQPGERRPPTEAGHG